MIGTKLAHYEISSHLGTGGMGEVYQATDSKLGRSVAIKLLPAAFAQDAERLARFEREARVLASLNHPNIAAIYGVDESGGRKFLVMELVPGETLADRIRRGPLSIEEALKIAENIGEALETAHEKGVIHRDLKPANVKITPDGKVKVLDFGLAKAMDGSPASAPQSNSPTIVSGSMPGVILGTAAYMSPEQARGQAVDKRTDIWSFGVVLFEMLTGRRLFEGESLSDTLAAVLKTEPHWNQIPIKARRLLQQCLERDPKKRLRDLGDAWLLLADAPKDATALRKSPLWLKAAVVGLALIAGVALWAPWRERRPPSRPESPVDFDLGPDASPLSSPSGPATILSPDGTRLVFVALHTGAKSSLYTRRLDQPKATEMAGTMGAYGPFFSPNGQWVGFFADGRMKKIRLDGGDAIPLCDAPAGRGASWGDDDRIIAALDTNQGLSSVPADAGVPVPVTHLDPSIPSSGHRWPQVLPGSKAVLFTTSDNGDYREGSIAVASIQDGHTRTLIDHKGMYGRYLAGGYLVYISKGTLFGIRFDPDRLETRGAPVKLLDEQVSYRPTGGSAAFDLSQNGTVLYQSGREAGLLTVQWLYAAGKIEPLLDKPAIYQSLRFSPLGERLAIALVGGPSPDGWAYDLQGNNPTHLGTGLTVNLNLTWSNPDGRYLVFHSAVGMSWTRANGAGKPQPLTKSNNDQYPWSFSRDGKRLVYWQKAVSGFEIWTIKVESDAGQLRAGTAELFLKVPNSSSAPSFSPDGRWIAYASTEQGGYQVYVRAFPDNGDRVPISNSGGSHPVWSLNGHDLFYRNDEQRIMVATYTVKGDSFVVVGKPRVWSERQLANTGMNPSFDLAPDGRVAALMPAENPGPPDTQGHVTLVMNFFDELRRRVAEGK